MITKKKEVFGTVVFDETGHGSDELALSFFTTTLDSVKKENLEYPQRPVAQSWQVEYPMLAYKSFTPDNKEICIVNLAQNTPQKVINLGEWEFVSFVTHTHMVNRKLFRKNMETSTNIMLLVKREE